MLTRKWKTKVINAIRYYFFNINNHLNEFWRLNVRVDFICRFLQFNALDKICQLTKTKTKSVSLRFLLWIIFICSANGSWLNLETQITLGQWNRWFQNELAVSTVSSDMRSAIGCWAAWNDSLAFLSQKKHNIFELF